ncbi:MAG: RagB/SusD family nutrient uptake outer membrane protein [Chitinophagaceae bacterium]
MKTKNILRVMPAVLVLGFTSCKKSFYDQKPYSAVALSSAITSDADMNAAMNGVYATVRSSGFYGRSLPLRGDIMSDNCFVSTSNSGRYLTFNQYTILATDSYVSSVWSTAYSAIKNANNIINSTITSNDNISQLKAEAYTMRALMYFELVRNFALPYTMDPTKPGVPIILEFDQNAELPRSTVKEVYAQINSDLAQAASLVKYAIGNSMTFNSTGATRALNSSYITKYAITALQARVYQHMGEWESAKTAAQSVVTNGGFSLVASTALATYWSTANPRTDKAETIFEIASDANNNNGTDAIGNMYLQSGYGDVLCTPGLYAIYSSTDVRKSLITPGTRTGQLTTAYIVKKYSGNTTDWDDIKIIRYADVLLILAEAYYNTSGGETLALQYLNQVAKQRDPSFAGYTSTGAQVLEDILSERRKELAFEGSRFWDLYRLQRSFTKVVDQDATQKNITVTTATTNFIFPIPDGEKSNNKSMEQNPGYN